MYTGTTDREQGRLVYHVHDSIKEFVDGTMTATKEHPRPFNEEFPNESFHGCYLTDIHAAAKKANEPWEDGMRLIEEMIREVERTKMPKLTSRKRRRQTDEYEGDDVDLHRLREGSPFWIKTKRKRTPNKSTITIMCEMSAAWFVPHKDLLWRGCAALSLTYLLEKAGYRVELWAVKSSRNSHERGPCNHSLEAIKLKSHNLPVNIGLMAVAVSPWFYRTLGFHSMNLYKEATPTKNAGFEYPEGMMTLADLVSKDENILIVDTVWNREDAIKYIQKSSFALEEGQMEVLNWAFSWERVMKEMN